MTAALFCAHFSYLEYVVVLLKTADLKVIMLNKPRGVLSSKKDDKKIKLVFDFLPKVQNEPDWIAVGRLDINTSGLMLFTNDGTLAHQLMHPSFEIDREYLVRARGHFNEQKKKNMLSGVKIENEIYQFSDIVPGETYNSEFKRKTSKYHSPTKKFHFLVYSHSIVAGGLLEIS